MFFHRSSINLDAWILTAGVNNGVSKLVGEGISHYRLLREYSNKVKCIGMTMWGTISENTRLELKNVSKVSHAGEKYSSLLPVIAYHRDGHDRYANDRFPRVLKKTKKPSSRTIRIVSCSIVDGCTNISRIHNDINSSLKHAAMMIIMHVCILSAFLNVDVVTD
jgi:hypothetical protein